MVRQGEPKKTTLRSQSPKAIPDMPQASASIISNISEGTGLSNYTAHCGSNGWGDPSFNTSDVSTLQNFNEYGLVISNCCLPNKFDEPVCFGEALLRAEDKGAVGHIGASNNTYWDEDYWWAVGNVGLLLAAGCLAGYLGCPTCVCCCCPFCCQLERQIASCHDGINLCFCIT